MQAIALSLRAARVLVPQPLILTAWAMLYQHTLRPETVTHLFWG